MGRNGIPSTGFVRASKQKTLPSVLTIEEVHQVIGAIKQHRNAAYFWTVYSLALQLEEAIGEQRE